MASTNSTSGRIGNNRVTPWAPGQGDRRHGRPYHGLMVIRAPLVGSQLMRVSDRKRPPLTANACPVCLSGPGEFCRGVISEAGAEPIRLGGYLIDAHPARVDEPSREIDVGPIDANERDVELAGRAAADPDISPTDSNL